jgi:hypothetical protein
VAARDARRVGMGEDHVGPQAVAGCCAACVRWTPVPAHLLVSTGSKASQGSTSTARGNSHETKVASMSMPQSAVVHVTLGALMRHSSHTVLFCVAMGAWGIRCAASLL